MENCGEITACDLHDHRIKLVEKACNRLGITNTNYMINDATILNEKFIRKFDKILLDVPCLGIGVIKRKPDIKWNRNIKDIDEIKKIQYKILENASLYLKDGGSIVYSTCSILKAENEDIVNEFIKNNEKFELKNINFNENSDFSFFAKYLENNKYLKVYPNFKTDGFFIAKLIKKK